MIASTVWNQLKATLEGCPVLSEYIKFVYDGFRFNIEPESLPCIMLEPVRDAEVHKDMGQIADLWLTVNIYAFSDQSLTDFSKTIVGDKEYRGVIDIANDIRAVLQSSYTLGGNVIDVQFSPTEFDLVDIEKFPVRGLVIPTKILYRQTDGI